MLKTRKAGELGFTLIELMIVVAIIGILAAIAIPKFADLVKKSQEGKSKGNLSTVRSSLAIYYGDNDGIYPQSATSEGALTNNSKYLKEIPNIVIPAVADQGNTGHGENNTFNEVVMYSSTTDAGQWEYIYNNTNINWGHVWIGCSHNDSKGKIWQEY
ncbi:type II secretion system protein [Elusimicrobiota bacterium]